MTLDNLLFLHAWITRLYGASWFAFALLAILTRAVFLIPLMSLYAVCYGWYLLSVWNPRDPSNFIPAELALLALRTMAGLEALFLVMRGTPSAERRSLVILLAAVAMLFLTITSGVGDGDGMLRVYRAVKWQTGVALGVIALIASACIALYPTVGIGKRYGACVAWLLVVQAAQVVWYLANQTGGMRMWAATGVVTMGMLLIGTVSICWSLASMASARTAGGSSQSPPAASPAP